MPAKYVLRQSGKGYHFNLLATNGRVIASSEHYETKRAAMAGIASCRKNAGTEVVVDDGAPASTAKKPTARTPAKRTATKRTAAST